MKSADHLKRLQRRLTAVYALAMTIGLLGFGNFLLNSYLDAQREEVAAELLLAANQAASAVAYGEEDVVDTSGYDEHELAEEYPQLWIVGWDESEEAGYSILAGPAENYYNVDLFQELDAVIDGSNRYMYSFWDDDAEQVGAYVRGVPITYSDGYLGYAAALAVIDPEALVFGYSDFRLRVIVSSIALLAVSSLLGYIVAGRSMRPARESLEQQERLIADAAHELRTPVARIKAVAEGGIAGDEPAGEALQRVAKVADSASGLVDDLLVLARMDAGNEQLATEKFRLDLLVEAVADNFDAITIEAVPTIMQGDPNLIKRAVVNLIGNAVEHGRAEQADTEIRVTVFPVQVIVTDSGPGVDPELGDRLFERFQSGNQSSGHGLGLAIVKWIMQAHSGAVNITASEQGGTAAALIFPASQAPAR